MQPLLTVQPIGFIRCPKQVKFQALHQPAEAQPERNVLELLPDCDYELALRDLSGFSRVWLLWWFHRNASWRPLVLPPRGPAKRRGVFATRSPYRPNPLGLTPVQLLGVEKRRLILGPCDLIDGTPVLDIKPYFAAYDSFPDASGGWIDEVEAVLSVPPEYSVRLSSLAEAQAEWLRTGWDIDFLPRMTELLARDPSLHRARRIKRRGDSLFLIGCGAWRGVFTVDGKAVEVQSLEAGYALRFLKDLSLDYLPDREAQLAFIDHWKQQAGVTD
jgi:tRNA (adenine37-N6)-methyltransferase